MSDKVNTNGKKQWKKVEVKLEDHVNVPIFPSGLSLESYDRYFNDYLSKIAMERFPQNRPLWELHIIKYPNTNAAGNVVFKLHQSLGDGYSLMGALLSCLQRADNPSLSLTFPSRKRSKLQSDREKSLFSFVPQIFSSAFNTLSDFGRSILKSNLFEDDQTPIRSGDDRVEFLPITITTVAFSLDKLKLIKSKLGVTINDVISGIIFMGTRLYMQEINHESIKSESTALVVLNTRMRGGDYKSVKEMLNPETKMPWGNRFSFLHVEIPTLSEFTNPIDFVTHAHRIIKKKRSSYAVYLNGLLLEVLKILGGHEVAARYVTKTLRSSSMTISNMIGPVEEMSLANHPITGFYFVGAGLPEDLGITIVSYMGKLRVAFRMAKGHIDSHKLKSCVENAFETIFEASNKLPSY
nr:wax ester synthase/diacylglycerol acyltransferase 4-like [Ziziphus jujuba var. spinosa]